MGAVETFNGFELRKSEVQSSDLSFTSYVTGQIPQSLRLYFLAVKLYTNNLVVLIMGLNKIENSPCNAWHTAGTQHTEFSYIKGPWIHQNSALRRNISHFK